MTTNNECRDDLTNSLTKGVIWRKGQLLRWPDDSRNVRAVAALSDLALRSTDLADSVWISLKPYFHPTNQHWRNAVSLATREIGFKTRPASFAEYAQNVLAALAVLA